MNEHKRERNKRNVREPKNRKDRTSENQRVSEREGSGGRRRHRGEEWGWDQMAGGSMMRDVCVWRLFLSSLPSPPQPRLSAWASQSRLQWRVGRHAQQCRKSRSDNYNARDKIMGLFPPPPLPSPSFHVSTDDPPPSNHLHLTPSPPAILFSTTSFTPSSSHPHTHHPNPPSQPLPPTQSPSPFWEQMNSTISVIGTLWSHNMENNNTKNYKNWLLFIVHTVCCPGHILSWGTEARWVQYRTQCWSEFAVETSRSIMTFLFFSPFMIDVITWFLLQ